MWRSVECAHPEPQAGVLLLLLPRNCHSAGGLLETRVPRYTPPTCGGSDPPDPIHRPHQAGALFSIPPRNCHSATRFHQTRGLALGTAPARPQPVGFSHRGTSRSQMPTSAHTRCRAGNREEREQTQHTRNLARLPLKNPQPHHVHPASLGAHGLL